MSKRLFAAVIWVGALLLSAGAWAEQKKDFGKYEVHYSVINSTFLTPEVAKAYGITRGKDRAIVNIAVREKRDEGGTAAKRAVVTGSSSDLIHKTKLDFHEIDERDAIYYIAELRIANKEKRDFRIKVQPDPNRPPFSLNFNKTLYTD